MSKKTEVVGIHKLADKTYKELRGRRVRMKKEARKEAREEEESEESLVSTVSKEEVSGCGLPKMKMPHLVQIKEKLERMHLFDVAKGTS